MNATTFPTEQVKTITGTAGPGLGGIARCDLTPNQLRALIECGAADPDMTQNSSPSLGEFLTFADKYPAYRLEFISYIVYPPRSDARVSVEGFNIYGLTIEECLELTNQFRHANELDHEEQIDGSYSLRAWWD